MDGLKAFDEHVISHAVRRNGAVELVKCKAFKAYPVEAEGVDVYFCCSCLDVACSMQS